MGYTCPVCEDPQADGVHLANHLAFTALSRGGDHETWLDDHVPDWGSMDKNQLSSQVTPKADETEYPQVFEDTTHDHASSQGESHDQQHTEKGQASHGDELPPMADLPDETADDTVDSVIEDAVEMTRERQAGETDDSRVESDTESENE